MPHFAKAYFDRADSLYDNGAGDIPAAIADDTKAIEINPDYGEAYANRATARQALGDLDGAIEDLPNAIRLRPRPAEADLNRGDKHRRKDNFARCSRIIRKPSSCARAWFHRGTTHDSMGEFSRAVQNATRAMEISPNDAETLTLRGIARQVLGDLLRPAESSGSAGTGADHRAGRPAAKAGRGSDA